MAKGWCVRDVMNSPATTIPCDSTLLMAALTMRRDGIRHLPVVEGVRLMGVITERDINRCAPSRLTNISQDEYNAIFENNKVERVMTHDPQAVSPNTPVSEAVALMQEHKLGCLPVVEGDCLVGIVTRSDLVSLLSRFLNGEAAPDGPQT
jgi:acetoin utilization protein AcuB